VAPCVATLSASPLGEAHPHHPHPHAPARALPRSFDYEELAAAWWPALERVEGLGALGFSDAASKKGAAAGAAKKAGKGAAAVAQKGKAGGAAAGSEVARLEAAKFDTLLEVRGCQFCLGGGGGVGAGEGGQLERRMIPRPRQDGADAETLQHQGAACSPPPPLPVRPQLLLYTPRKVAAYSPTLTSEAEQQLVCLPARVMSCTGKVYINMYRRYLANALIKATLQVGRGGTATVGGGGQAWAVAHVGAAARAGRWRRAPPPLPHVRC
jgi:hypothetical protein